MSQDKEQGKNIVVVGSWNAEEHMDWAKKNVARSYQLKDDGVQKVKYATHVFQHLPAHKWKEMIIMMFIWFFFFLSLLLALGWSPTIMATGMFVIWRGSLDRSLSSWSEWTIVEADTISSASLPWVNAWVRQYPHVSWLIHSPHFSSVRCKESESPHAVTVYMLEPQTCQYILGVSVWVPNLSFKKKKPDSKLQQIKLMFQSLSWTLFEK